MMAFNVLTLASYENRTVEKKPDKSASSSCVNSYNNLSFFYIELCHFYSVICGVYIVVSRTGGQRKTSKWDIVGCLYVTINLYNLPTDFFMR